MQEQIELDSYIMPCWRKNDKTTVHQLRKLCLQPSSTANNRVWDAQLSELECWDLMSYKQHHCETGLCVVNNEGLKLKQVVQSVKRVIQQIVLYI